MNKSVRGKKENEKKKIDGNNIKEIFFTHNLKKKEAHLMFRKRREVLFSSLRRKNVILCLARRAEEIFQVSAESEKKNNKAGYTATPVASAWAGGKKRSFWFWAGCRSGKVKKS